MGWAASLSLFKAKNGGHETPRSTGYLFPVGKFPPIDLGGLSILKVIRITDSFGAILLSMKGMKIEILPKLLLIVGFFE